MEIGVRGKWGDMVSPKWWIMWLQVWHMGLVVAAPTIAVSGATGRGHWGIENKPHWSLDATFWEDDLRQRVGHSAENLSRIRRLALNLLRQDKSVKVDANAKRLKACLEEGYLLRVLGRAILMR